jgi:hypothetical protein
MKKALKQLLDALDSLAEEGQEELSDTAVREEMYAAVHNTLIEPQPDYRLPDEFMMFTPEGNLKVKAILAEFFAHPEFAEAARLPTRKARQAAFEDGTVESSKGNTYDEYFGAGDEEEE